MAGATSGRLDRLERFLDDLDNIGDPGGLEEPFRTLWFRIYGHDPGSITLNEHSLPSAGAGDLETGSDDDDIEISPATKDDIKGVDEGARKGRIEIISPKEMGPTIEMKVQEKPKVTFKAAVGEDLKAAKTKEEAAKSLMEVQRSASPLKGMGGEAGKLYDRVREVAMSYRDGSYDRVNEISKEILERLKDPGFRSSAFNYLKNKVEEYEKVGADMTGTRDAFKEAAISFKEDRDDLIELIGACNAEAEKVVSEIMEPVVEVVAVRKSPKKEGEKVFEAQKKEIKPEAPTSTRKVLKKPVRRIEQAGPAQPAGEKKAREPDADKTPGEVPPSGEASEARSEVERPTPEKQVREPGEGQKQIPVIKTQVVKRKMVQLVPRKEQLVRISEGTSEPSEPEPEPVLPEKKQAPPGEEPPVSQPGTEVERNEQVSRSSGAPQPEPKPRAEEVPAEKIDEAFKKIQFVYNVAMKMHSGGRDVSQIFDLLNYAEKVRSGGDMRSYVGVADQCESMVIKLQGQ